MTALVILTALVLYLLLVVAAARHSRRRQDTWVCRICEEGFGDLAAAEAHLIAAHHRTP